MKNFIRIAALMLCLLLAFPAAIAQEAAYVMGEPASGAFEDAFAAGKLVGGDVKMNLALDAQMLGIPEEELELVDAVLQAIAQSKLTFGAGQIDDGLRIALGAEMTDAAGANPVGVSALADVTTDGIAVESDLIPGKRLTVKWQTLLALCGLNENEIAMIMSIRDIDPEMIEQVIMELMAELEPMVEMAAQLALPYAQTVVGFVQTLPIEVKENLTEEDYPPTAMEISITVTQKDLGALLTLLCDQLDQDNSLKVMLNSLLAEADAGVTVEEFIADLRGTAAQMTNTDTPVTFYLGMNEYGVPMYVEADIYNQPTGESIYSGLFLYQDADGIWTLEVLGGMYDAQGNAYWGGYLGGSYQKDPADENVFSALTEMYCIEGETPIMEMMMTLSSLRAEDSELPAYDVNMGMSMYVDDGYEGVQSVASMTGRQGLTAAGGESAVVTATTDTYVDDIAISQTETVEQLVEPTADGGVTGYTKVTESMPASGIEKLEMTVAYFSEDIDMAASQALEQIALETATNEQMEALMMDAETVLTGEKLNHLMNVLPKPLLNALPEEPGA